MQGKGDLITVDADKLLVVSNVRHGELPNLESLADSIRARGVINALLVFNVEDNISVIESEIPKMEKRVKDAQEAFMATDESEMPEEFKEAELAYERQKNALQVVMDDLAKLKEVKDPSNTYRIVDGHRRFAAGVMAEEEDFDVIVRPAVPDPSDVIFDQIATGLEQATLSPLDEARAYEHLERTGLTRPQIATRVGSGVSRSTILQRIKFLHLANKAEEIGSDSAMRFHDGLEAGEVKIQVANKMAQYLDREDITPKNFESMMETAMTDISGQDFVDQTNKKYGARKGVTTEERKGGDDDSKDTGGDTGGDDGDGDDKPRRRSEKELAERREIFTTLLAVAQESLKKKGKKSSVSGEDIKYLEGAVCAFDNTFGGPEPSIPKALQPVYDKLMKESEEKKNKELAEKKKAKDARRETTKKAKAEENLAKKAHRASVKEHYNMFLKPAKKKMEKIEKQIAECDVLAGQNPDEKDKHEQQKVVLETTYKTLNEHYKAAFDEWTAMKEPWLVEEEKKKAVKAKEKAENDAAKDAEEGDSNEGKSE